MPKAEARGEHKMGGGYDPNIRFRQFLRVLLTKKDSRYIMHDVDSVRGTKSATIWVSRGWCCGGATHKFKFKVQFESINSLASSSLRLGFYSLEPTHLLLIGSQCNFFAMLRTPQPLGVTAVPTLRKRLLSAVFASTNCILSFEPTSLSLVTYYWSVM